MKIKDLGNIYSSGNDFTTKAALLQSLYRFEKSEPCGSTVVSVFKEKDSDGKRIYEKENRHYGHIVNDGFNQNKNFYFKSTFDYAHNRVKNKKTEETINVDRLFNNLLSSMPLAFNLFHPLITLLETQPTETNKLFAKLFPEFNLKSVEKIDIEFIPLPTSKYTDDRSAMDAVIFFKDHDDYSNIIAIEVKYTDSLGTNKARKNDLKVETAIETNYFTNEGIDHIKKGCNQIYRNFLLTEKYRLVHKLKNSYSIILAPKQHPTTDEEITSLKRYLNNNCHENKLKKYNLEDFVDIISQNINEEYASWINWFRSRYMSFDKVEELFKELKRK